MRLTENPFFLLGATPRTRRDRLGELADERALVGDDGVARGALSCLATPRRRLTAEIAWCPGMRPSALAACLGTAITPSAILEASEGAPALARCNLLAEGLFVADRSEDVATLLEQLADEAEDLDGEDILDLINEERAVAGFPAVSDRAAVDVEFGERREHWCRAGVAALRNLTALERVATLTDVLELAVQVYGDEAVPALLHKIVDAYELDAEPFFEKETAEIQKLASWIGEAAAMKDHSRLNELVAKFERVVRNWDYVAQPIQLSARARGLDHERSIAIAGDIRSLAIELFNQHDLLEVAKRLTAMQQEVFAELDSVAWKLDEDAQTLENIANARRTAEVRAEADEARRREELAFDAEFGLLSKQRLNLSADAVTWNGHSLALDDISMARWGATRHSINGIPTGTAHSIVLAGSRGRLAIGFRGNGAVFGQFVDRLFRGLAPRIIGELVRQACDGGARIGSIVVHDDGVDLEKWAFLRANDRRRVTWSDLAISSYNGSLELVCRGDKGFKASLSYQNDDNVHFLEALLRVVLKSGKSRLTGAFR